MESARAARRGAVVSALVIVCVIFATYFPAGSNEFTNWDDHASVTRNSHIQKLSAENLLWCLTTITLGHYQPVVWLTYMVDHSIGGLDPRVFHLSQITLHILASLAIYALTVCLLRVTLPTQSQMRVRGAALIATLLFAVHPLRVEPVAWITARGDVLVAMWMCLSVLAYVKSRMASNAAIRRVLNVAAFMAFAAAVLSKEIAVVLPLMLILIDYYPLRRTGGDSPGASQSEQAELWLEKAAYFFVAGVAGLNAIRASGGAISSIQETTIADRIAQMFYSLAYYPCAALWPSNLSALHEIPGTFGLSRPDVVASALAVIGAAALLWRRRRQWPGLSTAAAAYAILILPVSGVAQRGAQLVAERYSYVASIPLTVVIAAAALWGISHFRLVAAIVAAALVVILGYRSREQIGVWHDSIALWQNSIAVDSHNGTAHANLGDALMHVGRDDEAIREFETALLIRSTQPGVHRNLAALCSRRGNDMEAAQHYLAAQKEAPADADLAAYLAAVYLRMGRTDDAVEQFQIALRIDSGHVGANLGLAKILLEMGRERQAEMLLRHALERDAENTVALELLAQICANTGRNSESLQFYDRLITIVKLGGNSAVVKELAQIRQSVAARLPATRPSH